MSNLPVVGWYPVTGLVLVFGTICLDRVRRVPLLPSKGHYVEVTEQEILLGGEAANSANALLRWGDPIELYGNCLGEGIDADLILELATQKGLPTGQLFNGPVSPPVCDIYVTPDGERTMFGAGFSTSASVTDAKNAHYKAGNWFTADPNLVDASREAARLALENEMLVYLMDFVQENDPIAPNTFWQSSTDWVGYQGNTQKNMEWVKKWVNKFGCFTVLSDGPNGFVGGSPTLRTRAYPPFPCPVLVDSTGAGDIFRAAMLHGLQAGWEVHRCLMFASAAGCLKCGHFGANTYVPTVEEIWEHVEANPEVSEHYC
jgi:sugar/nucleoside kinase (ribokinase family)